MFFQIEEVNEEYLNTKRTVADVIGEYNIIEFSVEENTFAVKIKDHRMFRSILRLFYYLYILEKLYSQKYPIPNRKDSKRHLLSTVPRDSQAYLLKIANYTIFLTYFGYHDTHINPFYRKRLLVGDFKKAFKEIERQKHTTSPENCPITLMFRYHLSERSHILYNILGCKQIDLTTFSCNKGSGCGCLEKIENVLLTDSENRECNLKILGGSQAFFEIDYELVEKLINLEFLEKAGYESIFNFLLGCYLSNELEAKFNSNVRIKFDGDISGDIDIILIPENEVVIIETTREHDVCGKSDEKKSKLKKAILHCAPIYSAISKNSEDVKLKFALITLTPEDRFTECAHYEDFIKQLFNFIHIGVPESVAEEFLKFNYFSTHITDEILNYQLKKLIENLKT